jgi:hypothetical protein
MAVMVTTVMMAVMVAVMAVVMTTVMVAAVVELASEAGRDALFEFDNPEPCRGHYSTSGDR